MAELRVHSEARAELLEAIDFYRERADRGDDLAGAVEEAYERIAAAPDSFSPTHKARRVRSAKVRGYPYRVFFVEIPGGVLVLAVAHAKQKPFYWRDRLES